MNILLSDLFYRHRANLVFTSSREVRRLFLDRTRVFFRVNFSIKMLNDTDLNYLIHLNKDFKSILTFKTRAQHFMLAY